MTAPGDFSSGDVLTAADMNDLPAGILGFNENTSSVSLSTSPANLTSVTFTISSTRTVLLSGYVPVIDSAPAQLFVYVGIRPSGGGAIQLAVSGISPSDARATSVSIQRIISLTAGTYTYELYANTGSNTCTAYAASAYRQTLAAIDLGD